MSNSPNTFAKDNVKEVIETDVYGRDPTAKGIVYFATYNNLSLL